MALLDALAARFTLATLLVALLGAGCEEHKGLQVLGLELYDTDVSCDLAQDACSPAAATSGSEWMPELLRGKAHVDSGGAAGYLFLQFTRPSGAVAILEAELPDVGQQGNGPLTYREYLGGKLTFKATKVSGRIEIPAAMWSGEGEACGLGRAELRMSSPGPDGKLGTADDEVRGISRARFGDASQASYRAPLLAVGQVLEVVVLQCEGSGSSSGGGGSSGEGAAVGAAAGADADVGCGFADGDGDDDSDDWGSDDWGDSSGGGGSSGGGSSDSGGSDWGGDSWDGGGDSGWEGDTWDFDESEMGDWGGWQAQRRTDPRPFGAAVPLLLLGLFGAVLRRR